jgi:hypothetical protein
MDITMAPPLFQETPSECQNRLAVFVLWHVFGGSIPEDMPPDQNYVRREIVLPFGRCSVIRTTADQEIYIIRCNIEPEQEPVWTYSDTLIVSIPKLIHICRCQEGPHLAVGWARMRSKKVHATLQAMLALRRRYLWRYLEIYDCLLAGINADRNLLRALFDTYLGPYGWFSRIMPWTQEHFCD